MPQPMSTPPQDFIRTPSSIGRPDFSERHRRGLLRIEALGRSFSIQPVIKVQSVRVSKIVLLWRALVEKIRAWAGRGPEDRLGFLMFKFDSQLSVEHMSQGDLAGNSSSLAVALSSNLLGHILTDEAKSLQRACSFALEAGFESKTDRLTKTESLLSRSPKQSASIIMKKLREDLPVGRSISFQLQTLEHAMIMFVQREEDDASGKKQFRVELYNSGTGNRFHHQKKVDGRALFQASYEIEHVSEEALCSSDFLEQLCYCQNMSSEEGIPYLYQTLLPSLGKQAKERPEDRFWYRGQIGSSCTATCVRMLFRAHLAPAVYKQFCDFAKMEMLLRSWEQITKGSEVFPTTQKIVTLEVVTKLVRSLAKRGLEIPRELGAMKKQLEGMLCSKLPVSTSGIFGNLQAAFQSLMAGVPSEGLVEVQKHIAKIHNASLRQAPFSEKISFLRLSEKICRKSANRPLALEQIAGIKLLFDEMLEQVKTLPKPVAILYRWFFGSYRNEIEKRYIQLDLKKKLHLAEL